MCSLFLSVSLLQCLCLLHGLNHSACYNSEFIIDSPLCKSGGYLAPRRFLFGQISPSSTCGTDLRGQRDYHIVRRCCKVHNGDTILKKVCIPGQKALLSSPLSQMARYCSRGNRCDSGKRLTSTELFNGDYVSLEFDCVHAKDEIHVNSDEMLYGKNVYLISDRKDGSIRDAKCVAYSNNPQSSIVISLVDNLVGSGTCTVSFATSMARTTTINCAQTEIVNGCNDVLYTATSSRVYINLTMNVLPNSSDRQFLWMMASVSDGGNLTVACGKKIPLDRASSTQTTDIQTLSTGSKTTTATGLSGSVSSKGSVESTLIHLNSDSSSGLQFITSSSSLLTTFGRKEAISTTVSLAPTKWSSSLPQTYQSSHSRTKTVLPSLTHSTKRRVHSSGHTPYSIRPNQRPSSSEALSSSNVTPSRLMTTKPTSGKPKFSAFMSFSPQSTRSSPSSTSMMRTGPPSNRISTHQRSGPMLATSNATSFESNTTTGTIYSSRVSRSTTVPINPSATWLRTSKATHGSRRSTQTQLGKTNSTPDSSSGLQFTTSSSPLLSTLGRIQTRTKTPLQSTKSSSSLPETYSSSPFITGTVSPPQAHSTTGALHHAAHTSYSTRPTQRLSSVLFQTPSSSSVTPFRLMKTTTKQTSHAETVSASDSHVPTPSSPISSLGIPKSSAFMPFSPQPTKRSPSSSTSVVRTVSPSNVTSPLTNRTSAYQPSGPSLPSTKNVSSLPQTYSTSHSVTETLSSAVPSGVTTNSVPPSVAETSTRIPATTVNMYSMYLPTVSTEPPVANSTWNTGTSDNNDDKIAFILEVITSLTGATLLILLVITTAMCLCFKKRMNELKRNSRPLKKLSETRASNLELKKRSIVSLESGYCSNSISS